MIVEFSGIPRSGKTTSLEANTDYFARRGYTVKVLAETARSCPFYHQHRVPTAFWIANRVVNDVIEASLNQKAETLTFQDRGLFDAIAFLKLLELEGLVSAEDRAPEMICTNSLHQFLEHISYWGRLVDLVILFETEPSVALERDLAARMSAGPGIITNLETMRSLERAYKSVIDEHGSKFLRIERLRTIGDDPLATALKVRHIVDEIIDASQQPAIKAIGT